MQPKFTPKKLEFFCTKIIAIALVFLASTQISFAQQKPGTLGQQKPGYENTLNIVEKLKAQAAKTGNIKSNDAGILSKVSTEINSPEATCTTWTFSIVAGDPIIPNNTRPFRDGIVKTCAVPGACTPPNSVGTFHYKIFQWVNPVAQCVTVTYNATNANFSFVTVYNAAPTLTALCTNWVTDAGSSATAGTPIVFSFNGTAGTTYYFLVNDVGAPPADGTIQIDAGVCSSTPCSGAPAPGNTIATPNPVGAGAPLTLSVSNNPAVANLVHSWQTSLTGAAPWTTLFSGPGNTYVTSQVVARWYRDSVRCTTSGLDGISTPVQVSLLACGWSASTAYPITVLDQANVTVGTTLYSFAGVSNNVVIANSYKFDGTTWTPIAPTPQPLEYPAAVSDGGNFIYILGGASTTGASLTTLYRYDIAANTYTTLAPFGTGVWNPSAAYIGGKIYKFCGTAAASTNVMEVYTVASNTWAAGTPYPQALSFVTAIARNGFIYAAGGVSTATLTATNATYKYDPGTALWTPMANMAFQHWGASGDFYNNGFVVSGGYINGAVNIGPNTEQLDLTGNTWSALPDQMTASGRMGGAAMGGSYYNIGGRTAASAGFVGTTLNQKLFCVPPTPCSGTPNPGNTISSANPVCSGTSFTLSLQNNPFVSGFTYQWQSGPSATGPWTNLPGGTNITHTLTQTGMTWYRAIVTCTPSGLSGISTPLQVLDGQGVFTAQPPASVSVQCGSCATFSFTATGNSLVYAWEYRTTPGGFWFNVTGAPIAGATVSGQNTNTLTLCNVSAALNGYQFRGLISGPCTAIDFSTVSTLTVTPYQVIVSPTAATICLGQVQQICIQNTVAGPTTATFTSGPLNFNIPDNVATASTFTIPVSGIPAGALITNVRIHLNMTHTYPADMVLNLKGPNPTQILSLYKHNTNTDNGAASIPTAGFFDAICSMTGTTQWKAVPTPYRYGITPPTGPFAADALNGVTNPGYTIMDPIGFVSNATTFPALFGPSNDPNGTWTLAMCDGGPADLGVFTGWTIDIDYTAPVFATGVWTSSPAAPNTMFNNAAATIPYVAGTPQSCIFVKPTVNTNYTVVVTTATPCVSAPTTVPITVITPLSGLVPPANKTVCVGTNTSFTVGGTGGPFTYQWEVSTTNGLTWSVIPGATGATLPLNGVTQLMNNNLYRVTVNGGPCGSTLVTPARLNVNQLPVVTISASSLSLVPGRVSTITGTSTPAAVSWSWTRNGSTITGATSNVVTANIDQQGSYQATATDVNGCTNTSNILTLGSDASGRLWIYPNPNQGQFQVRLYYNGVMAERRIVRIYNMLGQLVAQKEFDLVSGTHPYLSLSFDLSIQAAGTYVVKVLDKNSQQIAAGLVVLQ